MKTGRFISAQIMGILKQAKGGVPVSELCREHEMSRASFYKWRARFWRDGCVNGVANEGAGGRDPSPEAHVC